MCIYLDTWEQCCHKIKVAPFYFITYLLLPKKQHKLKKWSVLHICFNELKKKLSLCGQITTTKKQKLHFYFMRESLTPLLVNAIVGIE